VAARRWRERHSRRRFDEGKRKLASFTTEHRCDVDLMPVEGRVYFVRKSAI
jgi:hypothetical protein